MDFNRFDCYGSYKSKKIANMTFILSGNIIRTLIVKSYDTEIASILFSHDFSEIIGSRFTTKRYSITTTRYQGIAAAMYINLIYEFKTAQLRMTYISEMFERTSLKEFAYMSVAERKKWSLI